MTTILQSVRASLTAATAHFPKGSSKGGQFMPGKGRAELTAARKVDAKIGERTRATPYGVGRKTTTKTGVKQGDVSASAKSIAALAPGKSDLKAPGWRNSNSTDTHSWAMYRSPKGGKAVSELSLDKRSGEVKVITRKLTAGPDDHSITKTFPASKTKDAIAYARDAADKYKVPTGGAIAQRNIPSYVKT